MLFLQSHLLIEMKDSQSIDKSLVYFHRGPGVTAVTYVSNACSLLLCYTKGTIALLVSEVIVTERLGTVCAFMKCLVIVQKTFYFWWPRPNCFVNELEIPHYPLLVSFAVHAGSGDKGVSSVCLFR